MLPPKAKDRPLRNQVNDAAPASVAMRHSAHEKTLDWLADHPGLLSPYEGEWVAVADCRIIAHSPSAVEVTRMAAERGVSDPLLIPVMPADFIGGWSWEFVA